MIIKSYEANKSNLEGRNMILLYGKNEGLQNETVEKTFIADFKGSINKYDENEFINSYEIIYSEILTKSLFDEKKILIISRVGERILKYIEEISDRNIEDTVIILRAGLLEKRSKLRIFFEKSKKLTIIPFYEDDARTLSSLANEYLNKNKIKLSRESINLLVGRSSGSRENLKKELSKIFNYSYSNKEITFEVVKKLSNLAENFGVNELADNYLSKNKKNIIKILNENNYSDDDCILILRTILNKSKRLLNILENYKKNENLDDVISKTKPPIFWKDKEVVKRQANTWELKDLKTKMFQINEVETLVKSNSKNSLNLVSDFIVNY
tara:strand:+ start:1273 stop:2250 length:978 start_codon:yes stop_codon:yes gene_type:complete